MERLIFKINKKYSNISLKKYFENFYVGKSSIYKLFLNNQVYVNDVLQNENYLLKENDLLQIEIDEEVDFDSYDTSIDVVYEDEHVLIVNKPVGILIHPDGNNLNKTLVNIVASYFRKNNIHRKVRYVHRIDLETSGLVIFTKDFLTYSILSHMVEEHILKREYLALVNGKFNVLEGKINAPIGRDRHVQNKYRVGKSTSSKDALTYYYVIKNYDNYAYIRLVLKTGRTHQIRVHMASINHPLLGDSLYGGDKKLINRVSLHSFRVSYIDPYTDEKIIVEKNPPLDMEKLIYRS